MTEKELLEAVRYAHGEGHGFSISRNRLKNEVWDHLGLEAQQVAAEVKRLCEENDLRFRQDGEMIKFPPPID